MTGRRIRPSAERPLGLGDAPAPRGCDSAHQQRALTTTVHVNGGKGHGGPDDGYGLGIREFKLTKGCSFWGHGGMSPGSASRTVATADGRRVLTMDAAVLVWRLVRAAYRDPVGASSREVTVGSGTTC
ncbi:hypothetical protein GCM10023085_24680 [Actinomadura viridis]